MNKLLTTIVGAVLGTTMAVGVGVAAVNSATKEVSPAHAAEDTVTWTATSGALGSGIGTGTISTGIYSWNYTRTLESGDSYTGWSSNCIQLGKNGGVENLTLTTSNIPGTIKSVSVECSSYQGKHNVSITVGSTTYLASTATASWTTVSAKSGTGTSSGTITVSFTGGTRALYIKSLSVTYDNSGAPTPTKLSTPEPTYDKANNKVTWTSDSNASSYDLTIDGGSVVHNATSPYPLGTLTNSAAHTVTVTAIGNGTTYLDSDTGSVTFALLAHAGSQEDPYTVADARAAIDDTTGLITLTDKYVTGIVSAIVTPYDSGYGNVSFDISDDGQTTSDQLLGFRTVGTTNYPIDSVNSVLVADTVTLHGALTKYNSTYEFSAGNELVNLVRPSVASIEISGALTNTSYSVSESWSHAGLVVTATYSNNLNVIIDSNDVTWTYSPATPQAMGAGEDQTLNITAEYEGESDTFAATVTVTEPPAEIEITYSSYSEHVPASGYAAMDWSADGITGKVYSIKNSDNYIQFQANASYIYNTQAISGYIKSITIAKASGSYSKLTAFVSDSEGGAITEKPASGGTDNNTDWTWTFNASNHYCYFRIDATSANAKYLSSITIEYDRVSTVDPTGIALNNSSDISMDTYSYGRRKLIATVEPFNANDTSVTWGTSNSSVATISDGVLTATGVGSTTVYAHTGNYDPENPNQDLIVYVNVTVHQAEYEKATFEPTSASAVTQKDDYLPSGSATLSSTGLYSNDKKAVQLASGKDATLTISGYAGMKITGVDLIMSSNGNAGSGSLTVTAGSTEIYEVETAPFSSESWNGAYDANACDIYFDSTDYVVQNSEKIVFEFAATVNSLYVHSISIRYLDISLDTWCQDFLDNFACDASGETAPSVSDWEDFGLAFLDLSADLKLIAKNADADEHGTTIEQAMAKYDYVVAKYGAGTYDDFIERSPAPLSGTKVSPMNIATNEAAITTIIVLSLLSFTTIGGYFLLRKKKED